MHKNTLWKKVLLVGIIFSLIGLAVTPSINAGITIKKDIHETIDNSSIETYDSEDDCNCNDEFDYKDKIDAPS
jgi:hypothetical protein